MRILFISTTFPDATSPARGTYNAAVCAALAREHSIHVVSPRTFTEAIPFRLKRKEYRLPECLSKLGIQATYPCYWYTPRWKQEHFGDQMWWSVRKQIQREVQGFQPDAILSYWAHPDGEVGVRAGQLAGVPSAVIVGGSDVLLLPNLPRRGPRVKDVLIQSDTVITVSEGLRNAVINLGVPAQRVQTIYQGIDPTVFHQKESRATAQQKLGLDQNKKHLLWVGRIVPVKALDVLLGAAMLLRNRNVPFHLHLIGNGPEQARLETQVRLQNLGQHVSFHGAIGHNEIADWYRAADATVISSDSEGLPNVLRESLACGTPFVSTDIGSIREIADAGYSQLCVPRNPEELAVALQKILTGDFARNAAKYCPRTWDNTARETSELFLRLQEDSRHPLNSMTTTLLNPDFNSTLINK